MNWRPGPPLHLEDVDPDLARELFNDRQAVEVGSVDAGNRVARLHQADALPNHMVPLYCICVLVDQMGSGCERQIGQVPTFPLGL